MKNKSEQQDVYRNTKHTPQKRIDKRNSNPFLKRGKKNSFTREFGCSVTYTSPRQRILNI